MILEANRDRAVQLMTDRVPFWHRSTIPWGLRVFNYFEGPARSLAENEKHSILTGTTNFDREKWHYVVTSSAMLHTPLMLVDHGGHYYYFDELTDEDGDYWHFQHHVKLVREAVQRARAYYDYSFKDTLLDPLESVSPPFHALDYLTMGRVHVAGSWAQYTANKILGAYDGQDTYPASQAGVAGAGRSR